MATVTTLSPSAGRRLGETVARGIERRKRVLRLLGAKSFEGVQIIERQARSIING